jgi:hypothetical protein
MLASTSSNLLGQTIIQKVAENVIIMIKSKRMTWAVMQNGWEQMWNHRDSGERAKNRVTIRKT